MKHFHGTPLGGKRDEIARFVHGRYFLVPWKRPEDLPIIADEASGFCFDNSAFTAWKSGNPITDWSGYFKWCREWARHPRFEFAIIPDVVDGSEADNDELISRWDKTMWHPVFVHGCPVWHLHESLDRLERLVRRWRYVAFGSSGDWPTPGTDGWWDRMDEALLVACDDDGRPRARLHGLRMLDPAIVNRIPFYSADSTNVAQNSELITRFGMYSPELRMISTSR